MARAHGPELCRARGEAAAASARARFPGTPAPAPQRQCSWAAGRQIAGSLQRPLPSAQLTLRSQQLSSPVPEGSREPPGLRGARSWPGKGTGAQTQPTALPGLLLPRLCRSGALHPNPTAITDSLCSPPPPGHPALSQQWGEGPWMGLQGPCPVAGRLSPASQGTAPGTRLPCPGQGSCAGRRWPSASHLYVSQQLLLAAADVLQLLALLRGQVTGH